MKFLLNIFIISCLFVSGCGSQEVKNAWKFTKRQYRTYVNTPASLNLYSSEDIESYQAVLSDAVMHIDSQLEVLGRKLSNAGKNINPEWVIQTMSELPWLSGIALVDSDNNIVSRYPEFNDFNLETASLLVPDSNERTLFDLRSYIQHNEKGSVLYLADPVFTDSTFRGVVVAYFKPEALLLESADPGVFIITSPSGLIWQGNYNYSSTPLASADWDYILKYDVEGVMNSSSGTKFYWLSRYFANKPLIYSISTDYAFKKEEIIVKETEIIVED